MAATQTTPTAPATPTADEVKLMEKIAAHHTGQLHEDMSDMTTAGWVVCREAHASSPLIGWYGLTELGRSVLEAL